MAVPLYLIRTAKAARRDQWDGPDRTRPLVEAGRAQAEAIADWLGGVDISHVLSSPATRCVETVSPLAERRGVVVETYASLASTREVEPILAWIRVLPEHSVLCSHGRAISRVVELLSRQGAELEGAADWRRGSTWVLDREHRWVARMRAVAPYDSLKMI